MGGTCMGYAWYRYGHGIIYRQDSVRIGNTGDIPPSLAANKQTIDIPLFFWFLVRSFLFYYVVCNWLDTLNDCWSKNMKNYLTWYFLWEIFHFVFTWSWEKNIHRTSVLEGSLTYPMYSPITSTPVDAVRLHTCKAVFVQSPRPSLCRRSSPIRPIS